jgi:Arc/MetJ family transcription regulator
MAVCRLFGGGMRMPTNLALDDSLIEEAVKAGNHRTKKEAVTAALLEYVQARKRREILEWIGKVDYYDDYEPKRLRDRKPR